MFSLEVEKDSAEYDPFLTLKFSSEKCRFTFHPEAPVPITVADSGSFNSRPSNGDCSFTWNSETITFDVGKYGDGEGGNLIIDVVNSPETMASLQKCLTKWNEVLSDPNIPLGTYTF